MVTQVSIVVRGQQCSAYLSDDGKHAQALLIAPHSIWYEAEVVNVVSNLIPDASLTICPVPDVNMLKTTRL